MSTTRRSSRLQGVGPMRMPADDPHWEADPKALLYRCLLRSLVMELSKNLQIWLGDRFKYFAKFHCHGTVLYQTWRASWACLVEKDKILKNLLEFHCELIFSNSDDSELWTARNRLWPTIFWKQKWDKRTMCTVLCTTYRTPNTVMGGGVENCIRSWEQLGTTPEES